MWRFLNAPLGNWYLVQFALDPTLWQIWSATFTWTWQLENSFYHEGFPEWLRDAVEPDSPYSTLNEELEQDW